MQKHFNVIVVGLGAMGLSACYHLACRGSSVLGIDKFGVPHAMGSSHGETRLIRLCYFEHPDYVPLLKRAYELWEDLEERSGAKLLFKTGGIYLGPPNSEFIAGTLRAAGEFHLAHESLDRATVAQRYPQFHVPDHFMGVYEPEAGFLLPERILAAHAELALKHGATLHTHEPVIAWQANASGVTVRTAKATYSADRLVLCGGAWSSELLDDIGVQLVVTRQVLGWVWPKQPELFALGKIPVWAIDNPDGTIHYGFPMLPGGAFGRPGFKIAHHFHGTLTTPQTINRVAQPEDEDDFRHVLQNIIPDADGPLLSMLVCMYTNSPDSHFIVDKHPKHENVILACGFSGHGFKFCSVMGEALADLAIHGRTIHPIGFLGLNRFAPQLPT